MISSFKQYLVEEDREIFFTFGRMNPPTVGHGKLLDALSAKAGRSPYKAFLSQSQDAKKNPLPYNQKIKHTRKMFPKHARNVISNVKVKTAFDALVNLYDQGYKKITMVVGSDRVVEFETLINKYNGEKARHGFYNFERIRVLSAGARDPDAEGVEGMSASKQRDNASNNDFISFSQGLPKSLSNKDAKALFNDVRIGMGLKESHDFKNYIELEPVSDIREKFVAGELFEPGDKVVVKDSGKTGRIHRLGTNYVIVSLDEGRITRQWIEGIVKEDQRYKDQPEWGTPESTKKARSMTPGQQEGLKDTEDNPCWDNYKPVGTKKKNGKTVPNCVPEKLEKVLSRRKKKVSEQDSQVDRVKAKIDKEKKDDAIKHDRMIDRASIRQARTDARLSKPKL